MPMRAESTSGRRARTVCALAAAYASAESGSTRSGFPTGPRYGSVRGLFVEGKSMWRSACRSTVPQTRVFASCHP